MGWGRISVIAAAVFCCCNALGNWYLWQRIQTPESLRAAASVRPDRIFYLAAELSVDPQGKWHWHSGNALDPAPEDVPVLRASVQTLQDPERLTEEIARQIRSRMPLNAVQLDLDVPEGKLSLYGTLLRQWRREFPELRWSVTLLPCHLERQELAEVLDAVDFWVLQLHGIAAPRHRQEHYALMDPAVVQRALSLAKQGKKPWMMALPTYAYVLQFRQDGSLKRLWAEGFPGIEDADCRIAAPDLPLIARIIRENPAVPVIWFRLPTELDRWSLDLETIRLLEQGIAPEPETEWKWLKEGKNWHLFCRFRHQIPLGMQTVVLPPEMRYRGEWMLFNGATAPGKPYGAAPEQLRVPPVRCGKWVLVAILLGEERRR